MWGRDPQPANALSKTDYMVLTSTEYAFKAGIWRIMDILDRHNIKATSFIYQRPGGREGSRDPEWSHWERSVS